MVCSHSLVPKYVSYAPDVDNYSPKFVWQNPLLLSFDAMQSELDTFCFHCKLCGTLAWVRKNKDLLFVFSSLILFSFWDFNRLFAWMEAGILCLFPCIWVHKPLRWKVFDEKCPCKFLHKQIVGFCFLDFKSSFPSTFHFFVSFFFTLFKTTGSLLVNGPQFYFRPDAQLKRKTRRYLSENRIMVKGGKKWEGDQDMLSVAITTICNICIFFPFCFW